jgi:hypothetical protein
MVTYTYKYYDSKGRELDSGGNLKKSSNSSSTSSSSKSSGTSQRELEQKSLNLQLKTYVESVNTGSTNIGTKEFVQNVSKSYGVSEGDVYNAIQPSLQKISEGKNPGEIVAPSIKKDKEGSIAFTSGSSGVGSSTLSLGSGTKKITENGQKIYEEKDIKYNNTEPKKSINQQNNSQKAYNQLVENLKNTTPIITTSQPRTILTSSSIISPLKQNNQEYTSRISMNEDNNRISKIRNYLYDTYQKGRKNVKSTTGLTSLYGVAQTTVAGSLIATGYAVKTAVNLINPIETPKSVYQLITNPQESYESLKSNAQELGQGLMGGKPESLGTIGGIVLGAKFGPKVESLAITNTGKFLGKGVKLTKDTTLKLTTKEISAESIVPKNQIETGRGFSTTSSSKKTIEAFEKVNYEALHLSSDKLPFGLIDNKLDVIEGRRGSLGLEDPGTYIGPRGLGSSEFLKVNKELIKYEGETQLSINPSSLISQFTESYKEGARTPEALLIKTKGFIEVPKNILNKPGFGSIAKFGRENIAGSGYIRLTKRGQIGKGEIKSQIYEAPKSFTKEETGGITALSPTRGKVTDVIKGEKLKEMGTIEHEAVLDFGNTLINKGPIGYTTIGGKTVLVRKAEIELKNKKIVETNNFGFSKNRNKNNNYDLYSSSKSEISKRPKSSPFSYLSTTSNRNISSSFSNNISNGISSFGISKNGFSSRNIGVSLKLSNPTPSRGPISQGLGLSNPTPSRGPISQGLGLSNPTPSRGPINVPPIVKKPIIPYKKQKENNNNNNGYDVVYRERGRVIKLNSYPLPINRAFNLAQNKVDNTTARSLELRKSGPTNLKDDNKKNNIYKYRIRKTKQALILVEKEKYSIDTRGEKKGLKISKGAL